jgi:hypothetical protein
LKEFGDSIGKRAYYTVARMADKRIALQRAIQTWTVAQGAHMPSVTTARATGDFTFAPPVGPSEVPLADGAPLSETGHVFHAQPSAESLPHIPASPAVAPVPELGSISDNDPLVNPPPPRKGKKRKRTGGHRRRAKKKNKGGGTPRARKTTHDVSDYEQAEYIKLWLPSDIPAERRSSVCSKSLIDLEIRWRHRLYAS